MLYVLIKAAGAQQIPLYSQLYFLRMLYNPALTAYNGTSNAYAFYRDQWTAIPGHPVTAGGVADFSLWGNRIGTGLHIYNDNTDIIHRTDAQLYYAQKIHLAKDQLLSLGFSAGIFGANIDFANAIAADAGDPHIFDAAKTGVAFDMNVGVAYQWRKLTIGFSIPQVANTHATLLNELQSADYGTQRQYIGNASYEISISNEKFNIEPSILVMNASDKTVQADGSVMANYKRILYLGLGYRSDYGMTAMAAVTISQLITIGYAYEYPVLGNGINYSDTKGTNEILFGIHFDKWVKKKEGEPKLDLLDSLMTGQQKLKQDVDSALRMIDSTNYRVDSAFHEIDGALRMLDTLEKRPVYISHIDTSGNRTGTGFEQQQHIEEQDLKLNEYEQKLNEHDQMLRDMRQRMDSVRNMMLDSMENLLNEYKRHISQRPAVNFPDNVDKNIKPNVGDVYRLNRVEFNSNSSYLTKESYPELDKVVQFLNLNPSAHIRITGHTDYVASDEYNQWLSDRRAKRVYDYLADKGIPQDRMSYVGFGKRAPIADNNTEEGRAKNRRVELEIIK